MPFTPIVGTLAYVWDRAADEVLLIHRNARADDDHLGKFNGLGGKLEADEDVVSGMARELREEANIDVPAPTLRGTITWTGFGPKGEDWLGFVFLVDEWTGTPPPGNVEGELTWVPRARLMQACEPSVERRRAAQLPLWAGDRHFIPLVFDADPRLFHGTMPYDGDQPVSWSYVRL